MKNISIFNKFIFMLDCMPTLIFSICAFNFTLDAIDRGFFDITDISLFMQSIIIALVWCTQPITYIISIIVRKKTKSKSILTELPFLHDILSIAVGLTPLLQSI